MEDLMDKPISETKDRRVGKMKGNNRVKTEALLLGLTMLFSAAVLGAQEEWASRLHYSSFGLSLGYNSFSPAGDSWYAQHPDLLKSTGGFSLGVRLLWSPNILGHFLSIGGEYQSLTVANYDSSNWYYVDTGKSVVDSSAADLWQLLIGMMLVNSRKLILQTQFGYGRWSTGEEFGEFTESVASARLVAGFPIIEQIVTLDAEVSYYKGLGNFKNSAFSLQLGLAFRF